MSTRLSENKPAVPSVTFFPERVFVGVCMCVCVFACMQSCQRIVHAILSFSRIYRGTACSILNRPRPGEPM